VRDQVGVPAAPVIGEDGVARLPLTGEMVFPHTLDRDPVLAPVADVGHALADRAWHEPLYDRAVLAGNTVPVAARVYRQDMYVDPALSLATAGVTGAVRVVLDDVQHHDGLRRGGTHLLDELVALLPEPVVAR
jgi:hypothetical protein